MIKDIFQRISYNFRRVSYGGIVGAVFMLIMDKGNNWVGWWVLTVSSGWIFIGFLLDIYVFDSINNHFKNKN